MVISDDKTQSLYTQLTSRIDKVRVDAAGATVTRIAELRLSAGEVPEQVEIAGLPLALDDSSLRVRVEAERGTPAIATDVRVGLAVPPHETVQQSPTDEEVREAKAEVRRIEDAIALIDNEIGVLYQLDVPKRPDGEPGKAPPASPIGARLVLANFKDEQVRARIQERRETQQKLRQAQEHLEDLLSKQSRASTVKEVRPHELRKTAVVRLSYEGEASAIVEQRLVVEYFVPGARWTPTYVCRLDSAANQATIAVRALICQCTGEDWSGVRLELSTAEPMAWCELPELPSLRLGRAQSVMRKSGWRLPPMGAEILFEDFDRHKQVALAAVSKHQFISDFSSVSVPAIPNLIRKSELVFDSGTQNTIADTEPSLDDVFGITQPTSHQSSSQRRGTSVRNEVSPFGKSLIASGYVDTNQMQTALMESCKTGRSLIEILEAMTGRMLPSNLRRQYKKQQLFELKTLYAVESFDPELNQISSDQVGQLIDTLLPIDFCRRYRLLPLTKSETQPLTLLVAMVDPDHLDAQDDLNRILRPQGITLQRRVITQEDYQQIISKYLDKKLARQKRLEQEKAVDIRQDLQNIENLDRFEAVDEVEQVDVGGAQETSISDRLAYGFMRLGAADDRTKRGNLSIEQRHEAYLEILKWRNVVVTFDFMEVVQQAVSNSQNCIFVKLPPGSINVRQVAGSFDYSYSADGRSDVPSDGEFHSVALTTSSTDVSLRYVVVPREDTNVFRIAQLKNPLQAPLLAGAADVYVDGEYILSTNVTTVPPKGKMELGLGVEQAIKVARNTAYQEARSNKLLLAFNKLRHLIKIDIANRLSREARIEVRERLPIPEENAKVEVQIDRVSPNWEKYEQQERGKPIQGGYRWRVQVPAGGQITLSVQYTVKTFVDSELIGGNRRE